MIKTPEMQTEEAIEACQVRMIVGIVEITGTQNGDNGMYKDLIDQTTNSFNELSEIMNSYFEARVKAIIGEEEYHKAEERLSDLDDDLDDDMNWDDLFKQLKEHKSE